MKIRTIQVTAGRTFNHPFEDYSNLRPEVTMTAELADNEDANIATRQLQQRAEGLVEDHKQGLLKSIEELHQLTERQKEIVGLERQLSSAQARIDEIRKQNAGLLPPPPEEYKSLYPEETPAPHGE